MRLPSAWPAFYIPMKSSVWMRKGAEAPKQIEYVPEEIVRLMVAGWVQCAPPVEASAPAATPPSAGEIETKD